MPPDLERETNDQRRNKGRDPETKSPNTPRLTQDTDMHEWRPLRYQLRKVGRDEWGSNNSHGESFAAEADECLQLQTAASWQA